MIIKIYWKNGGVLTIYHPRDTISSDELKKLMETNGLALSQ